MNFEFSEEQNLLREQARGFLKDNCSPKVVRAALEANAPFNRALWRKVADMGWTSTVIPEEYDGLGLSYLELSVIADELGRAMAPLPFLPRAPRPRKKPGYHVWLLAKLYQPWLWPRRMAKCHRQI
jgi:alkylation response protein AidB-like acyl-CoA dehydrogenase